MIERPLDRRLAKWILGFALVYRILLSALTPVPAEDAANYLWMAQQFAAGEPALALSEVFPPLLSMLIAPFVWIGLDPFRAGQLVSGVAGAASVLVLARAAAVVVPGGATAAATMLCFAPLASRYAGLVYSEPLFHLVGGAAVWAGLAGRAGWMGALAGLAFWVRPEAGVIPIAFALVRPRFGAVGIMTFAPAVLLLAAWRAAVGQPFDLAPVWGFNLARGVGAWTGDGLDLGAALGNFVTIPGLWLEAFALLGVVAVYGLWFGRRDPAMRPLLWMIALGVVVICTFVPRRRFLVTWLVAVAPFAARGLLALPERMRNPIWILILVSSILLGLRLQEGDRYAERSVGDALLAELEPGETVVGDMTRVLWFSGMRPLPPRHFTAEELAAMAEPPAVRFVVLGSRRPTADPVVALLGDRFEHYVLPETARRWAKLRGILVLERVR